ncbi:nicotinate phosphoribosyltransferase [Sphingomonas sp. SRS2]|uniref:nicotinate phosphoribosyltransferase n=1 Tax=Sphingomonas sp. SRS2 TaxID=133190 RepID=UPI00061840C1|nr:nicotinate phosphoribosyltransferase [Sphingomonas sp. SRS2]KKC24649.1 nicotinate phosphoribosyltransferase [Sphingomonas sp. SRS2]
MDFATRAYDHSFPFDPIIRSLLDVDFYKLLMQQFIWERYPNERVVWKLENRTSRVHLAEQIDLAELRDQLDHVRQLRFTPSEIINLRGQSFYGQRGIFEQGYLDTLRTFRLPEYRLEAGTDGQLELEFEGFWWQTTLWEIYALAIVNELRSRRTMRTMSRSQLDILYARAKVKLYAKLEALRSLPHLNLTDFGTRRRHGFLWQEHCVLTAREVLGQGFTGTSNVYLAMKHGLEAKGTNAHELAMVLGALARQRSPESAEDLRQSQYKVLQQWQTAYRGELLVFLPDSFGSTQFLDRAPQWVSYWKGARPDSKNPFAAGEELIAFWRRMGIGQEAIAATKLIIFSDGLDVALPGAEPNGEDIAAIYHHFDGRVQLGFGWGTNLTNDFIGCHPEGAEIMKALSLVAKIRSVNGHPAVKLSDNYEKATGPAEEVEAYRAVFGSAGMENVPLEV